MVEEKRQEVVVGSVLVAEATRLAVVENEPSAGVRKPMAAAAAATELEVEET